ncbi:MAG: SDR family NAD(P)-dependent oxidoreductase [Planktotalea sp.]|uniref:SDR family NAD(P)-dependent oxidoreductase n=1 Tax=Planktotalea sp. TaxID=2029877 RepID=UPI003C70E639
MKTFQGKTYWLIGASEGLGREIAKGLVKAGAHVIVSARSETRLQELAGELGAATVLPCDVTDTVSVRCAAAAVGSIDGVIYNAGAYEPMRTQDWDQDSALSMVDVNFTGALRVLGHIAPQFAAQNQGDITLIGSLAGYRGLPAAIGYGASKAALISLAETMRHDLRGSGVTIRVVNPGFIKTRLTRKNTFSMPQLMSPEMAARHVLRAMERRRFRTDFPRPFSWTIRLLDFLPDWIVYRGG